MSGNELCAATFTMYCNLNCQQTQNKCNDDLNSESFYLIYVELLHFGAILETEPLFLKLIFMVKKQFFA